MRFMRCREEKKNVWPYIVAKESNKTEILSP